MRCAQNDAEVSKSTDGRWYRKLHDRIIGKTVRSTTSTTRPDPFVKHTGAARRSPLLLLLFNTPLLLLLFNTTRKDPQAFLQTPKHGGRYRMDRGVWPTQPAIPRP